MTNDRILIAGVAWSLVLLGLLILREFLKPGRRYRSAQALRILNLLVVVVIVTFTFVAIVRLGSISAFSTPSPSPAASRAAASSPVPSLIAEPTP